MPKVAFRVRPLLGLVLPFTVFFTALLATNARAQDPPMKWGKVSEEHLAMTDFPADSNAVAVILGDYGEVEFTRDGMEMTVHHRVKLLSEAAYDDYGTVTIRYDKESQDLARLKAQTLVPRPGGGFDRVKVDKKSFFREEIGEDLEARRFTFPALQPGAIVEYSFTIKYEYIFFMPDWSFQSSEPVLWSEFRVEVPDHYAYTFAYNNIWPEFYISEQVEKKRPGGDITLFRWVMKDMPAIRSEPFMTTPSDYRASLDGQLAQYRRGNGTVENTSNTWERLQNTLEDHKSFGKQMKPSGDVRRLSESLTEGLSAPREKLDALYTYVRDQVEWLGSRGLFAEEDMDRVLESKQGDRADKAILLIALARAAGLEADPVLISTRDHGRVKQFYPMIRQFNQLLVRVDMGSEALLLDPNASNAPLGMLGWRSLNGAGMLLPKDGAPVWISLQSDVAYRNMIALDGTLTEEGTFAGQLIASDAGYSGLIKRNRYENADSDEDFVRDTFLDDVPDAEFTAPLVEHADAPDETLRTTAQVMLPGAAQAAGEYLYVFPVLLGRLEESPLRAAERAYPVDLAYKRDLIYNLRFAIPEGYVVDEMPSPLRVSMEGGGGLVTRLIGEDGGFITVQFRFRLVKPIFEPRQYAALRGFYDRYVDAMNEPIILIQGEALAPAAPAADASGENDAKGDGDGE